MILDITETRLDLYLVEPLLTEFRQQVFYEDIDIIMDHGFIIIGNMITRELKHDIKSNL